MKGETRRAILIGACIYFGLLHISSSIDRVATALADVQVNMKTTTTLHLADKAEADGTP
jgi:hypothetical protein